jgi:hypothetical protein
VRIGLIGREGWSYRVRVEYTVARVKIYSKDRGNTFNYLPRDGIHI